MARVVKTVRAHPIESMTLELTGREVEALNAMGWGIYSYASAKIGINPYQKYFDGNAEELTNILRSIGQVVRNEIGDKN